MNGHVSVAPYLYIYILENNQLPVTISKCFDLRFSWGCDRNAIKSIQNKPFLKESMNLVEGEGFCRPAN